jgi:hypothetical protein
MSEIKPPFGLQGAVSFRWPMIQLHAELVFQVTFYDDDILPFLLRLFNRHRLEVLKKESNFFRHKICHELPTYPGNFVVSNVRWAIENCAHKGEWEILEEDHLLSYGNYFKKPVPGKGWPTAGGKVDTPAVKDELSWLSMKATCCLSLKDLLINILWTHWTTINEHWLIFLLHSW